MAIIPITPDDFETFTITTHPRRSYSSSSLGITGSVYLYARRSEIERDDSKKSVFIDGKFKDLTVDSVVHGLQSRMVAASGSQGTQLIDGYMSFVNTLTAEDKTKKLGVIRFTPPPLFNDNTMRKLVIKDLLYHHYQATSPNMQWAYTNYHSMNFFTASCVHSSSVLLYPNIYVNRDTAGRVSGTYTPSGSFSFDFYINPRYTVPEPGGTYTAGTILHLSSTYALSLVSGSLKDGNNKPIGFRLLLQLSHSADIIPSLATQGAKPSDLIYMSDDNSLLFNNWHHVIVRWGTSTTNSGTGSFNIDGKDKGIFCVPSSSIAPLKFTLTGNPDILCVGNFYEGSNRGTSAQACFFATDPALREGVTELLDSTGIDEPAFYSFKHGLNAELHDLSIRMKFLTNQDIAVSQSLGPDALDASFSMYVPPFFTRTSPIRRSVGGFGGVLQTPFFAVDGATDDPFNIAMSFGVAGYHVNLDNFLRDFANDTYPRKLHMTASSLDSQQTPLTANDILYNDPDTRMANLFILPCDDGNFTPDYSLLRLEDNTSKFVDSLGLTNYSLITLDNLVGSNSALFGTSFTMGTKTELQGSEFIDDQIGFTPEKPYASPGKAFQNFVNNSNNAVTDGTYLQGVQADAPLTVYQRTLDPSSNQIVVFDISNMLYGTQIYPGSFTVSDSSLSGSFGRVKMTLIDDGNGNICRADAETSPATWNSVGNIFYAEGIVVIKSPHLCLFGKDSYEMEFQGEQNVHVMGVNVLADVNMAFSSSNPSYKALPPSGYANDPDKDFVYISNVYFHDNNYNVIAKTTLAQPIVKRRGDKYSFKIKFDF